MTAYCVLQHTAVQNMTVKCHKVLNNHGLMRSHTASQGPAKVTGAANHVIAFPLNTSHTSYPLPRAPSSLHSLLSYTHVYSLLYSLIFSSPLPLATNPSQSLYSVTFFLNFTSSPVDNFFALFSNLKARVHASSALVSDSSLSFLSPILSA